MDSRIAQSRAWHRRKMAEMRAAARAPGSTICTKCAIRTRAPDRLRCEECIERRRVEKLAKRKTAV
jgi:hypothetical protein